MHQTPREQFNGQCVYSQETHGCISAVIPTESCKCNLQELEQAETIPPYKLLCTVPALYDASGLFCPGGKENRVGVQLAQLCHGGKPKEGPVRHGTIKRKARGFKEHINRSQ